MKIPSWRTVAKDDDPAQRILTFSNFNQDEVKEADGVGIFPLFDVTQQHKILPSLKTCLYFTGRDADPGGRMPRKVIIDCDMGIDDAVALCMTLFDSRLEVIAVTATEGCVTADQANNNLQAIVTELDPDRYPRLGMASSTDDAPPVDTRFLYGEDGLGNAGFESSNRQRAISADKLIIESVRANADEVTILCLGPLTNLARAFRRDPTLPPLVDRVIMTGGSLTAQGNITPCAEFNFYFDPTSAQEIIKSRTTKILIPLDVTREVTFGLEVMDDLPTSENRIGYFLRQILPHTFRSHRQQLGQEAITLNDAVGALALLEPDLFKYEPLACDVETVGELTRGVLVADQRVTPEWRPNLTVATSAPRERVQQYIIDQLVTAGNATT
jgi:inosine-uridine nucleoside N-ribohydrolase